jgi:hypothetical protein
VSLSRDSGIADKENADCLPRVTQERSLVYAKIQNDLFSPIETPSFVVVLLRDPVVFVTFVTPSRLGLLVRQYNLPADAPPPPTSSSMAYMDLTRLLPSPANHPGFVSPWNTAFLPSLVMSMPPGI